MKKKEISKKLYILLMCSAFVLIIAGLALKFQSKKPQMTSEEHLLQMIVSSNTSDTRSLSTLDGVPAELLGYGDYGDGQEIEYYYDSSQIPTKADGVNLTDNQAWEAYYFECRHTDACTVESNVPNKNLNSIVICGEKYTLPFNIEDLPDDGSINELFSYNILNASERFYGYTYCRTQDGLVKTGNEFYVQTYPDTSTVNAVSVQYQGMLYDDTISLEIAGIKVGMKERDVIDLLGEGTQSNNDMALWFQEKHGLSVNVYQSTVYCNNTGIVVVTYDDNRHVISVSLYTAALRRNIEDENMIEVVVE